MKKYLVFTVTFSVLLLTIVGSAWAKMARIKEYNISAGVHAIELASFRGSIKWIPITSQEKARIVVEVIADGVSESGVRNALLQIRIVENIRTSSILLEARHSALPTGVSYVEVNYLVYAQPGQFRQFKAQTAQGPIEIVSPFNASLSLINDNAPIILHSGRGSVHLLTNHAPIELGELDLAYSSQVQTKNGAISGSVSLPTQGSFLFKTTNAPIELKMPLATFGTFYLSTSLGTVDFHLGDDIMNGVTNATIARGQGPEINVTTSNSTITISE